MKANGYDIRFEHHLVEGMTSCDVFWDGVRVGIGNAHCHPNDNYRKATGRKVALTKALVGMSKEDRTQVWKIYLERASV